MLAKEWETQPPEAPARATVMQSQTQEQWFYGRYGWCLDPHLTVATAVAHLGCEIQALQEVRQSWQVQEVVTNIYLLACGVLNTFEESIRGAALRIPRQLRTSGIARRAIWAADRFPATWSGRRAREMLGWRAGLHSGLASFLQIALCGGAAEQDAVVRAAAHIAAALRRKLPKGMAGKPVGVASPFRRLDLTPADILALGREFVARYPDRAQSLLLLGVRTSGSYFAPLLGAWFRAEGFGTVRELTVHPDKGPGRGERGVMVSCAHAGFIALVLDDSPHTGSTVTTVLDIARRVGFPIERLHALVPVHPANPDGLGALGERLGITLPPDRWRIRQAIGPDVIEPILTEYYSGLGFRRLRISADADADAINATLSRRWSGHRGSRLKRVYAVDLETQRGGSERRYVLAKSVGAGWLGYHAFLAGDRLRGYVPTVLGLREGLLFTEWVFPDADKPGCVRDKLLAAAAFYVAERQSTLRLSQFPATRHDLQRHENGLKLVAKTLSTAYGGPGIGSLARPTLEQALARLPCPVPTLIDGRMDLSEWVAGAEQFLKADFEHHGMGKGEVNSVDPAFDLADAILKLHLSLEEECALLSRYVARSGDAGIEGRLFVNKLLAGLWSMQSAQEYLFGKPQPREVQQAHHERFMDAWNFLTVEAARFCGRMCGPALPATKSAAFMLDVDGVIDRRVFGFPCATAAAIDALAALRWTGHPVLLNTARSAAEVRQYCAAYSLAGGIAENGTYLWNAATGDGKSLLDLETQAQLEELRACLHRLPGVFMDPRHRRSIRAFTYARPSARSLTKLLQLISGSGDLSGTLAPLPDLMVESLINERGLDRLASFRTSIDTTVVARAHDKGTGLTAFQDWALGKGMQIVAIGDSRTDLPMFAAATRSFAPAHIDCAREAQLLGCRIARRPHQRGLREIVHQLVGPGRDSDQCRPAWPSAAQGERIFVQALRAADEPRARHLVRALRPTANSVHALLR